MRIPLLRTIICPQSVHRTLTELRPIRGVASYMDKILKGAKPDELPIEQPNRRYLTIKRKPARAVRLRADSLRGRADELID